MQTRAAAVALLLAASIGPAWPQAKSQKPPPAVSGQTVEPQSTSASYGDWVVSCQRLATEDGKRICEVTQYIRVQSLKDPVALVAFGYPPGSTTLALTVMLPTNVTLEQNARAFADPFGGTGIELTWRRCIPGGCFASVAIDAEAFKKWRSSSEAGRFEYRDATGQELSLPFSMKGYNAALDALRQGS